MQKSIDLNCDLGEGMATDELLMEYISSANIACGYHAGGAEILNATVDLCVRYSVALGAHPGFNDKVNFGRIEHELSGSQLIELITVQLQLVADACLLARTKMHHVKLHGALYNMSAKNSEMSKLVAKAIYDFDPTLIYYGLSGSCMIEEAMAIGLSVVNEVFADRTYLSSGMLTPRSRPDALISTTEESLDQVKRFMSGLPIQSVDGLPILVKADTICLHGDGIHAVAFAKSINSFLTENQVAIKAPSL
jgi:5-oxoprolinase (ATP-hydrolysing) subunit A